MNPELVERALEPALSEVTETLVEEVARLLNRPQSVADAAKRLLLNGDAQALGSEFKSAQPAEIKISQGIPTTGGDTYLPPGIHVTSWSELQDYYSVDPNRAKFLDGMLHGLHDLKDAGINEVYLGGSFVRSSSVIPNDFDITFEGQLSKLMPAAQSKVLSSRTLMREAYGGDILEGHFDYFTNSYGGKENVGILQIDMTTLPSRPSEVSPAVPVYEAWKSANPTKQVTLRDRLFDRGIDSDLGYVKAWMVEPMQSSRRKLSSK